MHTLRIAPVFCAALLAACLVQPPDVSAAQGETSACIAPVTYFPLDGGVAGRDANGTPALGTYERLSPDGRFILRSYSGAQLGKVSLIELPAREGMPVKAYRTPFSNEAFPVQGTWRYLVDVNGEHFRFSEVLRRQALAKPLFRAGMTGFYAAASELGATPETTLGASDVFIRSLSWPQGTDPDAQGIGPLQIETVEVRDDGQTARVVRSTGQRFICTGRKSADGSVFALPMISVDGTEFSAIPQAPSSGAVSMRVYTLHAEPLAPEHPCDLQADLGFSPGKAVFGFPGRNARPWLTYSDLGHVYVFDRELRQSFRLDHARYRVLASAFPGLTRDGRVIYGATWRDCADAKSCGERAGYVVVDPYQSKAYQSHWKAKGGPAPKACITVEEVQRERTRFSALHGLNDQ